MQLHRAEYARWIQNGVSNQLECGEFENTIWSLSGFDMG